MQCSCKGVTLYIYKRKNELICFINSYMRQWFLVVADSFNVNFNSMSFQETVEVFLKHPSVKDDSDLEGRTSFMWAAGKGSDDVIRTMLTLKLDIDINMTDKYAGTGKMLYSKEPLHVSNLCDFHQVEILIESVLMFF